ncbi:MAG TPA: hypothetical protein EYP86_02925 [Candidatus Altiarchaeales archaeon]|nr:hypothetical protein [Candidatus Altiarchaeales archaeon]
MRKKSDTEKLHDLIRDSVRDLNRQISEKIGNGIGIDLNSISVMPVGKITKKLGDLDVPTVGIYTRILGNIEGICLLLIPVRSSLFVANMVSGRNTSHVEMLTTEDLVTLEELGESIVKSILHTLSTYLGVNAYVSKPATVFDLKRNILNFILIGLGNYKNLRMVIDIVLKGKNKEIIGHSMIILDSLSVCKMVDIISRQDN